MDKRYHSLHTTAKTKFGWLAAIGLVNLICLIILATPGPNLTQAQEALLYSENFDTGQAPGWNLESGWQVVQSGGGYVLSGSGHVWARPDVGPWGDYRFRFRVLVGDSGALHANFRMSNTPPFRRYFIGLTGNGLYLSKQVGDTFFDNLATASGLGTGWRTVEIAGSGPSLTVSVDGQQVMSYTDSDPLLSGTIAFESLNSATVQVDEVEIWGPAPPPTPTPDPHFTWVRTGGPLGGLGYDIRMRPDNPDIMYVTDAWAGVHKSSDGGRTWVPLNAGIEARTGPSNDAIPVFCLTIDPNNTNIVWIGLQNITGIYRSTDGGQTWEKRINGIVEDFGLTIRGVAIQPGNSNIVYTAGEISSEQWAGEPRPGREFDRVQGVVYKSTNAGQSWQAIWRGDNLARYVLIDPTNVNILYVSTGIFDREAANSDPDTNTPGGVGILKSTNGGQTWTQINNGLQNLYIGSLFMHPQNSQILLAGAGNNAYPAGQGIYRTTNGGGQWQRFGDRGIESVEFADNNPNVAYAGGAGIFYRSENGGQSWQSFTADGRWGPDGINPGFPIDFQVDTRNAQHIFINNYGGGNFLSEDGGQTWAAASTGYTGADLTDVTVDPTAPPVIYANGRSGPFKSIDGGSTWLGINPIELRPIAEGARVTIDPHNTNHILLSSAHWGWTFESMDGGTTWALVTNYEEELQNLSWPDTNQKFQGMQAITFAPSAPTKVYAGFGVWRCATSADPALCNTPPIVSILTSADGGHTWARRQGTAVDGLTVTEIVVHPTNADKAWAATVGGGVFRTTNGGGNWQRVASGLGNTARVMTLTLNPANPDVLYAGTADQGVFKSTNGGNSWQNSSVGMDPNEPIGAIVIDPTQSQVVYAGSWFSGVFMSEDSGQTWRLINTGLRTRSVHALTISADGTLLYAGTQGEGVFRLGELPDEGAYLPVILRQ